MPSRYQVTSDMHIQLHELGFEFPICDDLQVKFLKLKISFHWFILRHCFVVYVVWRKKSCRFKMHAMDTLYSVLPFIHIRYTSMHCIIIQCQSNRFAALSILLLLPKLSMSSIRFVFDLRDAKWSTIFFQYISGLPGEFNAVLWFLHNTNDRSIWFGKLQFTIRLSDNNDLPVHSQHCRVFYHVSVAFRSFWLNANLIHFFS